MYPSGFISAKRDGRGIAYPLNRLLHPNSINSSITSTFRLLTASAISIGNGLPREHRTKMFVEGWRHYKIDTNLHFCSPCPSPVTPRLSIQDSKTRWSSHRIRLTSCSESHKVQRKHSNETECEWGLLPWLEGLGGHRRHKDAALIALKTKTRIHSYKSSIKTTIWFRSLRLTGSRLLSSPIDVNLVELPLETLWPLSFKPLF